MAMHWKLGLSAAFCIAALGAAAPAQGVEIERGGVILYGSSSRCTQPATIDYKKIRKKTPEWQTIQSDGVSPDSARYSLLVAKMNKRIKAACRRVAKDQGRDCVVRKGDIADQRGLKVEDLTSEVIEELESDDRRP